MINRALDPKAKHRDLRLELHANTSERHRMRALRMYIRRLSVEPADALEVIQAVAFDLERVADVFGGSMDSACGDNGGTGSHQIDRPVMHVSRQTS